MFRHKTLLLALLVSGIVTAPAQAVQTAAQSIQGSITRTGQALQGTPAYEAIRQFLIRSTPADQHGRLNDRRQAPTAFSVTLASRLTSLANMQTAASAAFPPVPLPSGPYQAGDTFSVGACSGGVMETWEYEWVGGPGPAGAWQLVKYTMVRTRACSKAM